MYLLELVTLKRKYNQFNTKFKDLKDFKVAKLDAIN
jgi:hypothetical protein